MRHEGVGLGNDAAQLKELQGSDVTEGNVAGGFFLTISPGRLTARGLPIYCLP